MSNSAHLEETRADEHRLESARGYTWMNGFHALRCLLFVVLFPPLLWYSYWWCWGTYCATATWGVERLFAATAATQPNQQALFMESFLGFVFAYSHGVTDAILCSVLCIAGMMTIMACLAPPSPEYRRQETFVAVALKSAFAALLGYLLLSNMWYWDIRPIYVVSFFWSLSSFAIAGLFAADLDAWFALKVIFAVGGCIYLLFCFLIGLLFTVLNFCIYAIIAFGVWLGLPAWLMAYWVAPVFGMVCFANYFGRR